MAYQQAEKKLTTQGLVPQVSFVIGTASDDHLVLRQRPAALTLVTKGDTVYLTVSSGPRQELMPYVVGQTLANVEAKLRSEGFKYHVVNQPTANPALLGTVANQDPQSGSDYAQGTYVTLTVYKGILEVVVPSKNVIGEPIATARNTLEGGAGDFLVVVGRYTYSSTVPRITW